MGIYPLRAGWIVLLTACASSPQSATAGSPLSLAEISINIEELANRVSTAVVQVETSGYAPIATPDGTVLARRRSTGAGVIVDEEGHIITNAHVVQGAQSIFVRMPLPPSIKERFESAVKPQGRRVKAEIEGIDLQTDLALLKVDAKVEAVLPVADSDKVKRGQLVWAFGSPLGLEGSVTMGVVSAISRQLRPDDPVVYLQTDASINPGNSGGPLVDSDGRMVGINTLILSLSGGSDGVGFAVPSNIVRSVYLQLKKYGRVRRGTIGALTQSIRPAMASGLGLTRPWGAIVADVIPNSPADQAGLKVGDVIVELEGKPIENARQFEVNIYHGPIGGKIDMRVLRDGQERRLTATVTEQPVVLERLSLDFDPSQHMISRLGVLAVTLDDTLMQLIPQLRVRGGVLVAVSSAGHPLRPGDIIHRANNQEVQSFEQLATWLDSLGSGDAVVFQVENQSQLRYVTLRLD